MRLLSTAESDTGEFEITEFADNEIPLYAILSHTWGKEEVSFQEINSNDAKKKLGYEKIKQCCVVAGLSGYQYVWIDTCCIDKTSSAELSEAINSMYYWYERAKICYVYLSDVQELDHIHQSRWLTRGWTLQELIAPRYIIFLNDKWRRLGTKETLQGTLSLYTKIPLGILSGEDTPEEYSVAQRMSWAAERQTTRIEDRAYCLLGLFGVHIPLIYGEREAAFLRLQEEIMRISDDHSLFAWTSSDNRGGLLATSPAAFNQCQNIVCVNQYGTLNSPPTMSSRGVYLEVPFIGIGHPGIGIIVLQCRKETTKDGLIGLYVRDIYLTMGTFQRVITGEISSIQLNEFEMYQWKVRRVCVQAGRTISRTRFASRPQNPENPSDIHRGSMRRPVLRVTGTAVMETIIADSDVNKVWLMLTRSDIHLDLRDEYGQTLLMFAADRGYQDIVRMLIGQGANLNARDAHSLTPLMLAVKNGHKEVVKILREKGAEINVPNDYALTPMSLAIDAGDRDMVSLLLDQGAWVQDISHGISNLSNPPLIQAILKGHIGIVSLLLDRGASVDFQDVYGRTPFAYADPRKGTEIMHMLLRSRERGVNRSNVSEA